MKKIRINKGNLSSYDLFKSINDAEIKTFEMIEKGYVGLLVLDLGYLGITSLTAVAIEGAVVAGEIAGEVVGGLFSLSGAISFGIGAVLGFLIDTGIHVGFKLYKKYVEKDKYIELISNAKIELEKSLLNYEENINLLLKKITDDIQLAVKKFFSIQNIKLDGIKKHMNDWLSLREEILNCLNN